MANTFQNFKIIGNNRVTRRFGGTSTGITADPYITGYHFISFRTLPTFTMRGKTEPEITKPDIGKILAASCLSVTPPGGTLNKTEFTGLGGVKWSVPTNIDYGNTFTVKFLEYSSLPITSIFHSWTNMIRDYRTGMTTMDNYSKANYVGTMLYWTTKPDGKSIEYYACYTGVFPTKDPQDLFSSDLSSVDKLEIDMEFNCDYAWHEDWVYDECKDLAATYYNDRGIPGIAVDENADG